MKSKILLTATILFCVVLSGKAQFNKGQFFLGGSLAFSNSKNTAIPSNDYINNYFCANVQIGQLIKDNTVLGVIVSYNNSNNHLIRYPDSIYNKVNGINAGVFYRKYKRIIKRVISLEKWMAYTRIQILIRLIRIIITPR